MIQGFSRSQIAKELQIDRNSLRDFLERRGITPDLPNKKFSEELRQRIIELRNQSKRAKKISTQEITFGFDSAEIISLDQRAVQIRQCARDITRNIISIGLHLIAAKKELPHGNWSAWLEKEFEWTQQTANRFMRVAERFSKLNNVVQFQSSTLQAMLSLPAGDEQDFIDAQEAAGKPVNKMSAREVQSAVKNWKQRTANSEIDSETLRTSAGSNNFSNTQIVDETSTQSTNTEDDFQQSKQLIIQSLPSLAKWLVKTDDRETVAKLANLLKKIFPQNGRKD